jgi:teichuronic acid biosynthesis glycosyltransferase TuaC
LKVAIITSFFPSAPAPYTGVPILAQIPFLEELADVRVFCPRATYPPLRLLQPRKHLYRPATDGYDLPGVKATHIPFYTFPVIGRALNGYLSGRAVLRAVKKFAPDVILSYAVYPDGYGAIQVARRLGVAVILFAIGSDVRYVADRVQRRLVRSALERADYVLAVSHELLERAREKGARRDRSRAILNGCDTTIFHPLSRAEMRRKLGLETEARQILFVGRLVPLKGLRELLSAMPAVIAVCPAVELTIIGEGPLDQELRGQADKAGISARVRFISGASPAEISEWLAASDVTCLPSYTEGCPNVVVESLACGRPVVGTEVGGIPELVNRSNGILVRPHDPADLAQGLLQALQRTWDEPDIARTAQRSWRTVAKETIDICAQVLSKKA